MQIHIGSDHAGFAYKTLIIEHLKKSGHDVVDHGPFTYEALDDYPTFCLRAAEGVAKNSGSLGIVLGGSGNGEQISANKVAGIENDDQVDKHEMIEELQIQMLKAAEELEFEKAAQLRDKIATLKGEKVATPQIKKKRFKKR